MTPLEATLVKDLLSEFDACPSEEPGRANLELHGLSPPSRNASSTAQGQGQLIRLCLGRRPDGERDSEANAQTTGSPGQETVYGVGRRVGDRKRERYQSSGERALSATTMKRAEKKNDAPTKLFKQAARVIAMASRPPTIAPPSLQGVVGEGGDDKGSLATPGSTCYGVDTKDKLDDAPLGKQPLRPHEAAYPKATSAATAGANRSTQAHRS